MKKCISILLLLFSIGSAQAQGQLEYQFDFARASLAQRKIIKAIEALKIVYQAEPENANINFLMGAAYTELSGTEEEAMRHLLQAAQNVNPDYKVGSFQEKAAPIHVYYYLAVAYVEDNKCALAYRAFEEFQKYKSKVDQYYIDEVDRHMQKCPFKKGENTNDWNKVKSSPIQYEQIVDSVEEPSEPKGSGNITNRGLVTEKLEYTTNAPLYGVQIGSNLNPSPTSAFSNVKNVDVFIDSLGIIRYVVGHFSYRKQAENLLKSIKEKGFSDAYVVNVNNEKKYSNEVISYKNINLRSGLRGDVEYFVQLGSFQDTIPSEMTSIYFKIDGIQEYKRDDRTVIAIGAYDSFRKAKIEKEKAKEVGVTDAFVVAYNRGKKIPLYEAINYTDKKGNDDIEEIK
ncbi:SPOR domain-containing protein [Vicingaceae bacterium]|nr:SPOR domain-containing protein [Vicingaceae bacterium]MDB4061281.1 SPOR domain-containing protein [Vicingaceae bacterium]MDB9964438.1 SPOR domain-containing protein [Vicingaceae bacterium]MDC0004775.1 SPOR domain-containing protein [bacterium]MDC1451895.1 SPOR domain-containing protein [Vicingaceae bacterium]